MTPKETSALSKVFQKKIRDYPLEWFLSQESVEKLHKETDLMINAYKEFLRAKKL